VIEPDLTPHRTGSVTSHAIDTELYYSANNLSVSTNASSHANRNGIPSSRKLQKHGRIWYEQLLHVAQIDCSKYTEISFFSWSLTQCVSNGTLNATYSLDCIFIYLRKYTLNLVEHCCMNQYVLQKSPAINNIKDAERIWPHCSDRLKKEIPGRRVQGWYRRILLLVVWSVIL